MSRPTDGTSYVEMLEVEWKGEKYLFDLPVEPAPLRRTLGVAPAEARRLARKWNKEHPA